jgi:hypothetical protein
MKPIIAAILLTFVADSLYASDFATTVLDATFKLYNPASTSTCFLVHDNESDANRYLVTTAHSLERMKGDSATIVLRRKTSDGTYERVDFTLVIRKAEKPLWFRHKDHDVAVLKFDADLPTDVSSLPIRFLADPDKLASAEVSICGQLFTFTYPERFEANSAGFPVGRVGIFSSPPRLPSETYPTFLADFTTFPGDSGGPVFVSTKTGEPLMVGIVVGQHHHDEKIESIYESRLVKHPFRLGIVLHARYVAETLNACRDRG